MSQEVSMERKWLNNYLSLNLFKEPSQGLFLFSTLFFK